MASIFMRDQSSKSNADALLARVRPGFVPTSEQKVTVTLCVPFVAQHGKTFGKRAQKLLTVCFLYFLGARPRLEGGFPFINRARHGNALHGLDSGKRSLVQQLFDS